MKLTENEKIIVKIVLKSVIDNATRSNEFNGKTVYTTDNDLLISISGEDYKTLKRVLAKIEKM